MSQLRGLRRRTREQRQQVVAVGALRLVLAARPIVRAFFDATRNEAARLWLDDANRMVGPDDEGKSDGDGGTSG